MIRVNPIQQIRDIAYRVRTAIEEIPPAQLPWGMKAFPQGACGDAAFLLGACFADRGIDSFEYICGAADSQRDGTWTTHAWLARGHLVVDITADQFDDAPGRVIVAEPSAWHTRFAITSRSVSDFRKDPSPGNDDLRVVLDLINRSLSGLPNAME